MKSWNNFVSEAQTRKPVYYYHVSSQENRRGIEASGILGSKQAGDRDLSYSEDPNEKRVYLFSSEETAFMAAFSRPDSGIFGGAAPPFIFVRVNLSKFKKIPKIYDDPELPDFDAYYVIGDVPAQAIVDIQTEAEVTEKLESEEEEEYNFDIDGDMLYEDKEKLRVFEVELFLKIRGGLDQTLADIRSIDGVTIVSSSDTTRSGGAYITRAKIKFHPQSESMTGQTYIKQILIPTINSRAIPNCVVQRYISKSLRLV